MSTSITVTLSEKELSLINEFVDAGTENASDHLNNWAVNDGHTKADIKAKRDSIDAIQRLMANINDEADIAKRLASSQITSVSIHHGWVIYSAKEAETMNGKGFWNIRDLWVTEDNATTFGSHCLGIYSMPQSLCQDRKWINPALASITSKSGLDDALEVFCRLENLPRKSAKDLLRWSRLNHYQKLWLQQHQRQSA